jgi:putative ABC transport system substrate-binding protein
LALIAIIVPKPSEMTMRRRDVFKVVAGGVATWPLAVHAQKTVPVIGYLSSRSPDVEGTLRTPFLKALAAAGFVVGRDVLIEYRFSDGRQDLLRELATDLVRQSVSVLVATDRPSAVAAKAATSTIPTVFTSGDDPVRSGLVKSLSHPGGNATGFHIFTTQLGP